MRIAHVITRLIVGGAQENTIASVIGLRARPGLSVELIAGPTRGAEGTLEPWLEREQIVPTLLPHLIRPVHPLRDVLAFAQLTRHFRRTRPHLVHTHSGKAGILGRLAARRAGVPIIVHTVHGPSFGSFQGPLANAVFATAERQAGRVTDQFVSVAQAMTRQYVEAGIAPVERFTTIRSGFDLEPFRQARPDATLRAQLDLAPGDIVIGKIARLAPLKGHEDLWRMLPAFSQANPRIKVLLVGDGPLRESLQTQLRRMDQVVRVRFAGLVAPEEMARYVSLMDVVVHLSRREGLARALPQALAAGRPVVAYDCDGAGEVCRDGVTGFLLPPGDTAGATRRLLELAGDPGLRERLGRRGQELVCAEFSVNRMVEDLHALYLRLAKGRGRDEGAGAVGKVKGPP
jgi:glycosyltransferase involved in cell wall biosynthesis